MIINIFTETQIMGIKTTGLVTAYKELKKILEKKGIEVKVNAKENYDILHIHSFGPISLWMAMKEKKPIVITTHTVPEEMGLLYKGGKYFVPFFEKYLNFVYNQADLLLSPSQFAADRVKEIGVKKKILVQSNGIDLTKFRRVEKKRKEFREEYSIGKNEVLVGCVGLLSKRKGLDFFVEIAKRLPKLKFIWIGKNIYGRFLKDYSYIEKIKKHHPSNLILTGYVDDIIAAYSAMDFFLFPTRIETEGLVVLEAACSDIPIITSRVRGLDWFEEGKHCLKASGLDEYIKKLRYLKSNPSKAKKLVKESKKIVNKKNIFFTTDQIINYYKKLIHL